ncbi:MAG: response regulator [Gammaproteobacteria bacterium]|nr:response regulator [Gammaproteobacteria bacterium]
MSADNGNPIRCVLMVEDEMNLAMMLEDMLVEAGYRVLKAARVPGALALAAAEQIDAAILDVNLAGVEVFPVAAALHRRAIPFLFTTGYGQMGISAEYSDRPVLQKPYSLDQLMGALEAMMVAPARG